MIAPAAIAIFLAWLAFTVHMFRLGTSPSRVAELERALGIPAPAAPPAIEEDDEGEESTADGEDREPFEEEAVA